MKAIELVDKMTIYAKTYSGKAQQSIERNNHMNQIELGEKVQQRIIDAVIVDFINYIGMESGIDYGMCTEDLFND